MTTKCPPPTVILSMAFLGLTAIAGSFFAAAGLGRWQVLGGQTLLFNAVSILVLAVLSLLAFIDLLFRRPSGKYLALVPMLCIFGYSLRGFEMIMATAHVTGIGLIMMELASCFSLTTALATLILTLGFSPKVDAYFESSIASTSAAP